MTRPRPGSIISRGRPHFILRTFALHVALLTLPALLGSVAEAQSLEGRVTRIVLDNGMRFLVVRRPAAPVFSANLRFRVGGVDDPGGQKGMAHLFEHLAFKGTSIMGTRDADRERKILDELDDVVREMHQEMDRGSLADEKRIGELRVRMETLQKEEQELIVKDEFSEILSNNGAEGLNASTGADFTSYVVSLPANRLELWCLMESARLRDPVLREFYTERDVVMEERRMRIDNHPDGRLYEQLLLAAYQAHQYRVPIVGWMSDLERMTRRKALAFRESFYTPGNAVAAIVGDVDPDEVKRLVVKYFSGIPAGPPPPSPVTVEPPQAGGHHVEVDFDAESQIMIAYHKPTLPDPDQYAFEIIDSLMSSGRTSRLYRRLVIETQVASSVYTFEAPGDRYPNLFVIGAEPRAPHGVADVEREIRHELRRLVDEPVPDREMQKIRNQVAASFLYGLRSNGGLASQISYFEILTGDWKNISGYFAAIESDTREQVGKAAARVFMPSNRTIAILSRPSDDSDPERKATGGISP